jgi:starch-binding outer membrane protein, SusD/RagB family
MRTGMNQILKFSAAAAFLVSAVSCTNLDEQLNDRATEKITPDNSVGARDNVNTLPPADGLQSAFVKLNDGTATNGGFFAVQEGGTDEAVITQKGGDWYDGGLYIRIHHHDFSPQTWAINDTWGNAYGGIFQTNSLLADPTVNTDPGKVAQLRGLRAYFYWRLMDVFGNVPLVKTALGGDKDAVNQSQRPEVYAFIESELLDIVDDLPSVRQDYARINKYAAYALLARIYLNSEIYTNGAKKDYQKAIDAADMVINSGIYSLQENYADAFSPKNSLPENSKEHIFIVPFDESTATGAVWAMMTLHYPSQLTFKLQNQPWNGFSTLKDFYDSYDDADLRKKGNFIEGPQFDPDGQPVLDLAYDKGDPDGAPVNYTPFVNMLSPNASRQGGARFGKFAIKVGGYDNSDNDMPLLRYGEVLLNKAEAILRLNHPNWSATLPGAPASDGDALALINKIRARAGVPEYSSVTPGEFLAERGRELFVEAHRRTDLIRFGAYDDAWWEKAADPNGAQHILMAIPQEQMISTQSTAHPLVQNPGYAN